VVTCTRDDQTSYTSGIVWHTRAGNELRLLLPNDGGLDATGRALDMDCDGHAVTPESSRADCDDTRPAFYEGALDMCDGMDTNCDGAQAIATQCQANLQCAGLFGTNGVSVCDDTTGDPSDCHAAPSCACAGGTAGCRYCEIPVAKPVLHAGDATWLDVCYPATGQLSLSSYCGDTNRCDVEVVGMRGGWKLEISAPTANAFGYRAYDVGAFLAVRAKRAEDPATYEVMAAPFTPVGEIDLAIITQDRTFYLGLQLNLAEYVALTCSASPVMTCY
jgi:hypothetical protein